VRPDSKIGGKAPTATSDTPSPAMSRAIARPILAVAPVTITFLPRSPKSIRRPVEEGVLTLRGEKKSETEDKDRGYTERSYGRFERRIGLPKGVDRGRANATFKNGVLTITLPKTEAASENVRRIPVNGKAA